jgi:hypothetical protein
MFNFVLVALGLLAALVFALIFTFWWPSGPGDDVQSRIRELNGKFNQVLLFLSFALVVLATLSGKQEAGLHQVARWWTLSLFFVLIGILPLKEFSIRHQECWHRFVQWFKVFLLWVVVIFVGIGSGYFLHAITLGILR